MKNDGSYLNEFLKSLNSLTGKQLEKIGLLNEFIETYHVLKIKERFGDKYEILKHVPEYKDFNEDLIVVCKELEKDDEMEL